MWDKQRGEGAECEQVDCFKMRVERKLKEHGVKDAKTQDARCRMQSNTLRLRLSPSHNLHTYSSQPW